MGKTKHTHPIYRWHPEISTTIIYWSYSLGLLFLSVIIILEKIKFSWTALILFIIATCLVLNGWLKHLTIEDSEIKHYELRPKKRRSYNIAHIKTILLGCKGFTLVMADHKKYVYIMSKKKLDLFIEEVEHHPDFKGTIIGKYEKSEDY